jgi:hypothetical protein
VRLGNGKLPIRGIPTDSVEDKPERINILGLQDVDSFPRLGDSLSVFPSSDGLLSGGLEDGVSLPRSGLPSA